MARASVSMVITYEDPLNPDSKLMTRIMPEDAVQCDDYNVRKVIFRSRGINLEAAIDCTQNNSSLFALSESKLKVYGRKPFVFPVVVAGETKDAYCVFERLGLMQLIIRNNKGAYN